MDKEREAILSGLRDQIDDIDNRIQKLLIKRTGVVEKVREVKEGERVKIRPAREAEIMYRLMAQHKGPFGRREMFRMWRELIIATLSMEGPFSVAVHMPKRSGNLWDLARDHFGSFSEMSAFTSVRGVIDAVNCQDCTVGILPFPKPGAEDEDPWWRHLISDAKDAPKVMARLPFAGPGNSRDKNAEALVICPVPQEKTGRDSTFVIMELTPEASRDGIDAAMERAKLPSIFQARFTDPSSPDIWMYLVEVKDFIGPRDKRLKSLAEDLDEKLIHLTNIGGYAWPLTAEELGDESPDTKPEAQP